MMGMPLFMFNQVTLTIHIYEAGSIFGEMSLLGQGMHGSFAEALGERLARLLLQLSQPHRSLLSFTQRMEVCYTRRAGRHDRHDT